MNEGREQGAILRLTLEKDHIGLHIVSDSSFSLSLQPMA
jgi:hypothetical protein